MSVPEKSPNYSFAEYLNSETDENFEVIGGQVINMSPAPTPKHQDVVDELTAEFKMYLRGKECMAFAAPIDICLFATNNTKMEDIKDWVQPDLVVVCDQTKIGDQFITGAPDLIIEVLSPSTARNDRLIKYFSYEKARVREYWIVDPYHMYIEIFHLTAATFVKSGVYSKGEMIQVGIFPDMKIDLNHISKTNSILLKDAVFDFYAVTFLARCRKLFKISILHSCYHFHMSTYHTSQNQPTKRFK